MKIRPAILMTCAHAAMVAFPAFAADMTSEDNPSKDPRKTMASASEAADVSHVTVRHQSGRYFGWPANGGAWNWGNEILVQYDHGEFQDRPVGSHDINRNKPITVDQSRSMDGG